MNRIKAAVLAVAVAASAAGALGRAEAQETVRVGYSAHFNTGLPLYLSQVKPDIFEKHGIKLDLVDMRGSAANCVAAMLSDAVDACSIGTTAGTAAVAEGAALKVIAMLQGPVIEMYLSKAAAAKTGVAASAAPLDRIKGLKGLDMITAPPGTAYYVILNDVLHNAGMSMSDV